MTNTELLLLVLGSPIAFVIFIYLGRKYQRYAWMLDKPYADRVVAFCKDKR